MLGFAHSTLAALDLIFYLGGVASDSFQLPLDDDGLVNELLDLNQEYRGPLMVLEGTGVIFGAISIAGAWCFSRCLVSTVVIDDSEIWGRILSISHFRY